jgi:anti-anti-sigma factor
MTDFAVNIEKIEHNCGLITIKGSLDNSTADRLEGLLMEAVADNIYRFVVDLSEVDYIGSPGIGAFISIYDVLDEHKGTMVFIYPKPNVKATFKMFKLSSFYSIAKDKETALKELKALCR